VSDKPGIASIGTLNPMLDSMAFFKQAWQSMNLPASFAPTIDPVELDKRITDLKTVEQWLNVNLGMVRASIQGLEVQRSTLGAMQAFGQAMSASGDSMARMAQDARQPAASEPASSAPGAGRSAPDDGASPRTKPGGPAEASGAGAPDTDEAGAPTAWWNLLQGQFTEIARNALSGAGIANLQQTVQQMARGLGALGVPAAPTSPVPDPAPAARAPRKPASAKKKSARAPGTPARTRRTAAAKPGDH
jgi:hypothetical protein